MQRFQRRAGQQDFRQLRWRGVPRHLNVRGLQSGLDAGQKSPDRQDQQPNREEVPRARGEKPTQRQSVLDEINSQRFRVRAASSFARPRSGEKIAQAAAEFFATRAPLHTQIHRPSVRAAFHVDNGTRTSLPRALNCLPHWRIIPEGRKPPVYAARANRQKLSAASPCSSNRVRSSRLKYSGRSTLRGCSTITMPSGATRREVSRNSIVRVYSSGASYGGSRNTKSASKRRAASCSNPFPTVASMTSASARTPSAARFARISCADFGCDSTKITSRAPRLIASIPIAPVPAYRSKNSESFTVGPRTLKSVSRSRSLVGRIFSAPGPFSRRLRNCPAITRTASPYSWVPASLWQASSH